MILKSLGVFILLNWVPSNLSENLADLRKNSASSLDSSIKLLIQETFSKEIPKCNYATGSHKLIEQDNSIFEYGTNWIVSVIGIYDNDNYHER